MMPLRISPVQRCSLFVAAIAMSLVVSFFGGPILRAISLGLIAFSFIGVLIGGDLSPRPLRAVLFSIVLYGLFVRLAYVLVLNEALFSDMADQERIALNILQGKFDAGHDAFFRSFLAQGTAYYVAAVYWLFGSQNLVALRLANVFLAFFTNLLIYATGKQIAGQRAGLTAAFLFAFSHELVFWSGKLSTEHLLACLGVLSLYFVVRLWKERRMAFAVAVGLSLGYFYFTKNVILVPLVAIPLLLMLFPRGEFGRSVLLVFVGMLSFAAVLTPWVIRNYRLYGVFTTSVTGGWFSMRHQANDLVPVASQMGYGFQADAQKYAEQHFANDYQGSEWAKGVVLDWIKQHKRRYLKLSLGRAYLLFWENGIFLTAVNPYNLSFWKGAQFPLLHWNFGKYPFVIWLTLTSFVFSVYRSISYLRRKAYDQLVLLAWPSIFFFGISLLYILVLAFPRYRDAQLPFAYLMCGIAVAELLSKRRKENELPA